ncbi:hypothetical protein pb186bvf_004631 [Paramecium bursaria]
MIDKLQKLPKYIIMAFKQPTEQAISTIKNNLSIIQEIQNNEIQKIIYFQEGYQKIDGVLVTNQEQEDDKLYLNYQGQKLEILKTPLILVYDRRLLGLPFHYLCQAEIYFQEYNILNALKRYAESAQREGR